MSLYTCSECNKINKSSIRPPVSYKDGKGNVCPSCAPEVEEGHLEELRLQASEPQPLNGLGEE